MKLKVFIIIHGGKNMTFKIQIGSHEDAQKFNTLASKQPYSIWVHGIQGQADAKSLLGLMLVSMEKDLLLVVDDDTDADTVKKEFDKYIVG